LSFVAASTAPFNRSTINLQFCISRYEGGRQKNVIATDTIDRAASGPTLFTLFNLGVFASWREILLRALA
jgi:hypothetical protein